MKNYIFSSLILLLFSSCIESLYPISTNNNDIVFKSELLGHWKEADGNGEYIVDRPGDAIGNYYKVMTLDPHSDRIDTGYFIVTLINIKGYYFLDCIADTSRTSYVSLKNASREFLIPSHLIIKFFSFTNNSITLSPIEKDALLDLLKSKIQIRHEDIDSDHILLTEKPVMLQQKLLNLEAYPLIYKRDSLIRVK